MAEAAPAPTTDDRVPADPASSRGRAVAAVVCLVLAAVLTVPAGIA